MIRVVILAMALLLPSLALAAGDDVLSGLADVLAAEENQKAMSASAATAHCTQIRRLAKTYGFTKP